MSDDNIIDLGRHIPSVDSVISRLVRYQDSIRHIQVIVEWDNDECGVYGDRVPIRDLTYYQTLYEIHIHRAIRGELD